MCFDQIDDPIIAMLSAQGKFSIVQGLKSLSAIGEVLTAIKGMRRVIVFEQV